MRFPLRLVVLPVAMACLLGAARPVPAGSGAGASPDCYYASAKPWGSCADLDPFPETNGWFEHCGPGFASGVRSMGWAIQHCESYHPNTNPRR